MERICTCWVHLCTKFALSLDYLIVIARVFILVGTISTLRHREFSHGDPSRPVSEGRDNSRQLYLHVSMSTGQGFCLPMFMEAHKIHGTMMTLPSFGSKWPRSTLHEKAPVSRGREFVKVEILRYTPYVCSNGGPM